MGAICELSASGGVPHESTSMATTIHMHRTLCTATREHYYQPCFDIMFPSAYCFFGLYSPLIGSNYLCQLIQRLERDRIRSSAVSEA